MRRTTSLGALALMAIAVLLVSAAPAVAKHRHRSRRLGPVEGRLHVGHGRSYSTNWSGYAALGETFTQVEGSWVQPEATCNLKGRQFALAAFWVGLDGYENGTVEQTGTEADCEGKEPVYYAWYELYPERLYVIPMEVSPGDEFHAEVTQSTLFLKNESTGEEKEIEYDPGSLEFSSAEWIAEKPFNRFANFGSVHFTGANATAGGTSGPISSWENEKITLVGKGNPRNPNVLAEPSALEGGSAFTITQNP
jgi:hypothetical protein